MPLDLQLQKIVSGTQNSENSPTIRLDQSGDRIVSHIPEFLDAKAIACAFGISLATVKRYANKPDFPDPFEWSPGKIK